MITIGLFINPQKEKIIEITKELVYWLKEKDVSVLLKKELAEKFNLLEFACETEEIPKNIKYALVLGGDGTLLAAARIVSPYNIPLLGINIGGLGFLTEVSFAEAKEAVEKLLSGEYKLEERMMLEGKVIRKEKEVKKFIALNDAVVTTGAFARLVRLEAYVDEEYIATYPADGLIVATPTGSTAYSLAAEGPLVNPQLNLLIVTPICPHTLYARSLIVSENEKLRIVVKTQPQEVMLTIDGQEGFNLYSEDQVIIKKSEIKTSLIKVTTKSFYQRLRTKLKWGEFK